MTQKFTPELMKSRFEELRAEIERIESTSPRLDRDNRFQDLTQRELKEFDALIALHEKGLFELKNEFGFLAKGLGGRSMR